MKVKTQKERIRKFRNYASRCYNILAVFVTQRKTNKNKKLLAALDNETQYTSFYGLIRF